MGGPHTLPPEGAERTPPREPALPRAGDVLAERYEVESLVARGGMACIFRARHLGLDSTVAIKVMDPSLLRLRGGTSDAATRFTREARLASKLKHPSIVEIFDFGVTEAGLPFIVMEFLEGESLGDVLQREGPLSWARARGFVLQVLEALAVAHDAGMVHRDIKPENCFLVHELELVKVLDFGIAKVMHQAQRLTAEGNILGTPHYLSPEQASASGVDERTDVYAVGIMLYEMVSGSCPFEDGSSLEIVAAHINAPPPPLERRMDTSGLPPGLQALLDRVLAKQPDARPRDARAFAQAIAELDLEPAPVGFPWKRWARAGAVALALGFTVGGVAAYLGTRPSEADATAGEDDRGEENARALRVADVSATPSDRTGEDRPGEDRTGEDRTGEDRTGEDRPPEGASAPVGVPEPPRVEPAHLAEVEGAPAVEASAPALPTSGRPGTHEDPESKDAEGESAESSDEARESEPVPRSTGPRRAGRSKRRRGSQAPTTAASLRRAAASCDKFAAPGGTALDLTVSFEQDGTVRDVRVAPPYGDTPIGRCVAGAAKRVTATPGATPFAGKVRIGAEP